jgi:hypothetical protein
VPGIDHSEWTPRELRHSFVSVLSDAGIPVEQIAQLVGAAGFRGAVGRLDDRSQEIAEQERAGTQRLWLGEDFTGEVGALQVGRSGRAHRFLRLSVVVAVRVPDPACYVLTILVIGIAANVTDIATKMTKAVVHLRASAPEPDDT